MNQSEYQKFVTDLVKSGDDIKHEITPAQVNLWHLATGVSGEAGELLDAIKKHVIYQKPLDRMNVIEEVGDILFYLEGIIAALNLDHAEIVAHNVAKLKSRYSQGSYSNAQAITRADKDVTDLDMSTR